MSVADVSLSNNKLYHYSCYSITTLGVGRRALHAITVLACSCAHCHSTAHNGNRVMCKLCAGSSHGNNASRHAASGSALLQNMKSDHLCSHDVIIAVLM